MSEQDRPENPTLPEIPGAKRSIIVNLTEESRRLLNALAQHGLFGSSPMEVAERLLHEKLREVVKEGWMGQPGLPDGQTKPLIG